MSSHNRVHYVKQEQPAFLQKFKEKVGMKPEATVEDKVQAIPGDCNDIDEEKDDEKPVVVVLKEGDLTAEQAAEHEDESVGTSEGKIVYKKPIKRKVDSGLNASTKKPKRQVSDSTKNKPKKSSQKNAAVKVPPSLLSFEYDD